jgi:hypothetical protein
VRFCKKQFVLSDLTPDVRSYPVLRYILLNPYKRHEGPEEASSSNENSSSVKFLNFFIFWGDSFGLSIFGFRMWIRNTAVF